MVPLHSSLGYTVKLRLKKNTRNKQTNKQKNIMYIGTKVKLTTDFLSGIVQARRQWNNIFQVLKEQDGPAVVAAL